MISFFSKINPLSRYSKQRRKLAKALRAESKATMAGLRALQDQFSRSISTVPNLRRSIHVLEKGLCFPKRKKIFGLNFIGPAVNLYAEALENSKVSKSELKWASDVLNKYFQAVDHEAPEIKDSHKKFSSLPLLESSSEHTFSPYREIDIPSYAKRYTSSGIEALDQFHELCRSRRSHRHFKKEPVPIETVRHAITAALESPSACNRQPFDYYMATEPEMIRNICKLPLGVRGYGDDLPAMIVVVGNLGCYDETRDHHLIYIDSALATMTLMLALTASGLGSVPINWPDIPEKHQQMRELLNLKPWQVPVMLLGLGVPDPDTMIAYSSKRSVNDVLHHVKKTSN
jgi:nitroreductase